MKPIEATLFRVTVDWPDCWIDTFQLVISLSKVKQLAFPFCTFVVKSCCSCRPCESYGIHFCQCDANLNCQKFLFLPLQLVFSKFNMTCAACMSIALSFQTFFWNPLFRSLLHKKHVYQTCNVFHTYLVCLICLNLNDGNRFSFFCFRDILTTFLSLLVLPKSVDSVACEFFCPIICLWMFVNKLWGGWFSRRFIRQFWVLFAPCLGK